MKILFLNLILLITSNTYASDILVKTDDFSVKTSKQYARQNNPQFCRYQTTLDKENNQLQIRVGVVGSPVAHFGWNMPIDLQDLPLVDGYKKEYKTVGVTGMVLTYSRGTLSFKKMKSEKVWNRLYPFTVTIDSSLTSPSSFRGTLEGYERTAFGSLKKHVITKCDF